MYGVVVGKTKKNTKGEQITLFNIIHETEDYKIQKQFKTKWNHLI